MSSTISVYSQNVSGDKHSDLLPEYEGMKEWKFEDRIAAIVENLPDNIDVVAFNEIRRKNRIEFLKKKLDEKGFHSKSFFNNEGEMAFSNFLALRKASKWKLDKDDHKWVATKSMEKGFVTPYLSETFTTIEGDPHGRCAGLFYLHHKDTKAKVLVLVSHVVPFKVKALQQNALMSVNRDNLKNKMPTIIAGDLNRFPEESTEFEEQLREYELVEAAPTTLVIPNFPKSKSNPNFTVITNYEDIGTFTPWPIDKIYEEKISKPMKESRLDVQLYTKNENLIKLKSSEVKAVMFASPEKEPAPTGINKTRHILNRKMASDHLAVICTYTVFCSK